MPVSRSQYERGISDPARWMLTALLLLFMSGTGIASGEDPPETEFTVRMQGYADGTGAGARKQAIDNARQEAMRTVLDSMAGREHLEALRPILRNYDRYISGYDVLRYDPQEESTRVELDIHFREAPLRQDVALITLPRLIRKPSVQLIVGDQLPGDQVPAMVEGGAAEQALRKSLEEYGIMVSGLEKTGDRFDLKDLLAAAEGDRTICRKICLECRADVVVIGSASVKCPPKQKNAGGNVNSCRAEVLLRIFRGNDGKQMDEFTDTAVVYSADTRAGGEQAIADATKRMTGDVIVSCVLTVLRMPDRGGVILTVKGHGERRRFDALMAAVLAADGVSGIDELLYTDALARVQVAFDGPMTWLVDSIRSREYAGRALIIRRVVGRDMTVEFR